MGPLGIDFGSRESENVMVGLSVARLPCRSNRTRLRRVKGHQQSRERRTTVWKCGYRIDVLRDSRPREVVEVTELLPFLDMVLS